MQKKWIAAAVAVLAIVSVGWYFGSPYWTLKQMRDAAVARDAETVAEYVDFEGVRSSLKEQLNAKMAAEMARQRGQNADNPFGAMGAMLAGGIVNQLVDAVVTKEGVRQMMIAGRPLNPDTRQSAREDSKPADWTITRNGFSQFTLTVKPESDQPVDPKHIVHLVFERDGLSWRLHEIRLPDGPLSGGVS